MSQDIRRDREINDGRITHASIPPEADRWQGIAYNENERAGRLQVALDAANAKLAEANDALGQARRDAAGESLRLRIENYLKVLEQNADEDAEAALIRDPAIHAADSLFSQFQAANRARASRKVVRGLRALLDDGAVSPLADWERELLQARYWHLDNGFAGVGEFYRFADNFRPMFWYQHDAQWLPSRAFKNVFDLATDERSREITAAELPEGVTP